MTHSVNNGFNTGGKFFFSVKSACTAACARAVNDMVRSGGIIVCGDVVFEFPTVGGVEVEPFKVSLSVEFDFGNLFIDSLFGFTAGVDIVLLGTSFDFDFFFFMAVAGRVVDFEEDGTTSMTSSSEDTSPFTVDF